MKKAAEYTVEYTQSERCHMHNAPRTGCALRIAPVVQTSYNRVIPVERSGRVILQSECGVQSLLILIIMVECDDWQKRRVIMVCDLNCCLLPLCEASCAFCLGSVFTAIWMVWVHRFCEK